LVGEGHEHSKSAQLARAPADSDANMKVLNAMTRSVASCNQGMATIWAGLAKPRREALPTSEVTKAMSFILGFVLLVGVV
jgi:hypothetical protein